VEVSQADRRKRGEGEVRQCNELGSFTFLVELIERDKVWLVSFSEIACEVAEGVPDHGRQVAAAE